MVPCKVGKVKVRSTMYSTPSLYLNSRFIRGFPRSQLHCKESKPSPLLTKSVSCPEEFIITRAIFFPACAYVTYFRNKNRKAGTLAAWNAESIYSSLFFVKKVIAVLQQCSLRRYFSRVRYHMLIVTFSWPFYT